jgi:hypothetical protein
LSLAAGAILPSAECCGAIIATANYANWKHGQHPNSCGRSPQLIALETVALGNKSGSLDASTKPLLLIAKLPETDGVSGVDVPVSAGLRVIPASVSMQLNRSSMQLTDEQRKAIIRWAERTPELGAVILYGSRSTGKADAISDVNLALVMMENFAGDRRADAYLNNCEIWEAELAATLDLAVHLVLLDPPLGLQVPSFLAKGHTELWRRRN